MWIAYIQKIFLRKFPFYKNIKDAPNECRQISWLFERIHMQYTQF